MVWETYLQNLSKLTHPRDFIHINPSIDPLEIWIWNSNSNLGALFGPLCNSKLLSLLPFCINMWTLVSYELRKDLLHYSLLSLFSLLTWNLILSLFLTANLLSYSVSLLFSTNSASAICDPVASSLSPPPPPRVVQPDFSFVSGSGRSPSLRLSENEVDFSFKVFDSAYEDGWSWWTVFNLRVFKMNVGTLGGSYLSCIIVVRIMLKRQLSWFTKGEVWAMRYFISFLRFLYLQVKYKTEMQNKLTKTNYWKNQKGTILYIHYIYMAGK